MTRIQEDFPALECTEQEFGTEVAIDPFGGFVDARLLVHFFWLIDCTE